MNHNLSKPSTPNHDSAVEDDDDDNADASSASTVIVSVVVESHGPRIVFAAYREETNDILIEECISDGYKVQAMIERIWMALRPTMLLLPNKIATNDALLHVLSTPPPAIAVTPQQHHAQSIPYRLLKTSSYDVRACKALILQLQVGSLGSTRSNRQRHRARTNGPMVHRQFPLATSEAASTVQLSGGHVFPVSHFHAIASLIDFESTMQVQAVGSLVSFLRTTQFLLEHEHSGSLFVQDIVRASFSTQFHMNVSADTLAALHIFHTERHPLAAGGNAKEGFSLLSLLDHRTKSRAGRQRLREWMLQPSISKQEIEQRQDGVELFMQPEIQPLAGTIQGYLERIGGSVDKILARIQKCCAKPNDFLMLAKAISSAVAIIDTVRENILYNFLLLQQMPNPEEGQDEHQNQSSQKYVAFVTRLLERCHVEAIQQLFVRITVLIDEDATNACKTIVIRPGEHAELDAMKQQFERLEETLENVGTLLGDRYPHLRDILEVLFIPQVGFLIALTESSAWNPEHMNSYAHERDGGFVPDDMTFIFYESGKAFFKNSDMREMDMKIGDLDAFIKDTEALIVAELEDDILDLEQELRSTFIALAEMDCILAFASSALDSNYARPQILPADEKCILIRNGRHPLQEVITETEFIANHTNIERASNLVNIVTGPNFSGKSCYARQVGVLVFMAHIGCFIPCDAARISITDQILARFSTTETCSVPQSSFQLDLTQMGSILRRATPHSLVLIDEFGKGTSPASGIALLTAALQRLASIQCKVLCTTHFLEIFSLGFVQDGYDGIKALQMTVHVSSERSGQIKSSLHHDSIVATPLFILEEGVADSSAGLACAKLAGVKPSILERAHEILEAIKHRKKVQPLVEILRGRLFSGNDHAKDMLLQFLHTDWNNASECEIDQFLSKIAKV